MLQRQLLNEPVAGMESSFLREAEQKALAALGIGLTPRPEKRSRMVPTATPAGRLRKLQAAKPDSANKHRRVSLHATRGAGGK
jgi:hypothetical protein